MPAVTQKTALTECKTNEKQESSHKFQTKIITTYTIFCPIHKQIFTFLRPRNIYNQQGMIDTFFRLMLKPEVCSHIEACVDAHFPYIRTLIIAVKMVSAKVLVQVIVPRLGFSLFNIS